MCHICDTFCALVKCGRRPGYRRPQKQRFVLLNLATAQRTIELSAKNCRTLLLGSRHSGISCLDVKWCPRPDLNRDKRFRKPLLYPVELRGRRMNPKAGTTAPYQRPNPCSSLDYCSGSKRSPRDFKGVRARRPGATKPGNALRRLSAATPTQGSPPFGYIT
jgi:hypothetical protein